jgi:2-methylcitrate dehydratase PrpD
VAGIDAARTGVTSAELAAFAAELELGDLPPAVLERARAVAADTLGVIVAGSRHPFLVALREQLADGGPAPVLGTRACAAPGVAALLNAAACTALQADEGHRETASHPAIHVLPAAFAVAAKTGAGGAELLRALVGGYEVAIRVGLELGGSAHDLHTHGNWPVVGAAVAAGMVLRLGAQALEPLLDAAAMLCVHAPARTAFEGFTAHHYLAGLGAQTAVTLALGAATGMTSSRGGLAHLATVRARTGPVRLAGEWEILRNYFKLEPLCAHALTPLDAAAELLPEAGDIAAVTVETYGAAMVLASSQPATDLAARFSIPYAVAARLLAPAERTVVSATAPHDDAAVRELMGRVTVVHDPALDAGYPAGRPCRITLRTGSGAVRTASRRLPRGDWQNPPRGGELDAKFTALTGLEPPAALDTYDELGALVAALSTADDPG